MSEFFKYSLQAIALFGLAIMLSCSGETKRAAISEALINGDFETVGEDIPGWDLVARHAEKDLPKPAAGEPAAMVSEDAHSGKQSVHIFWDIPDTDS